MYHKFKCAQRMSHSFEEVTLSVGEVIHRISFPGSTRTVVRMFHHAIDNRVAEVHVGTCHVNFGTEHHGAFFDLAAIHFLKKFEALFDRTVPVRTLNTCLGRSTFLLCNQFGTLFVDICFSLLNQADSEVP